MNQLVRGMAKEENKTYTTNGMQALKSTMNPIVDLFFAIGASRGKDVTTLFNKAFNVDQDLAIRTALYARDVRGGMGERQVFRDILRNLASSKDWRIAVEVLHMVPIVGRWDDLFALVNTPVETEALKLYASALEEGDALAAKWAPREKSSKSYIAYKLRREMGLTPRQYRKLLVRNTDVVETPMSAKDYSGVEYDKLPSLASARYQNAFKRNDPSRYQKYIDALEAGEKSINASAVYPHDIVKSVKFGESRVAEQQWKALPDWIPEGKSFFPMVDVSFSMNALAGKNLSCMDVSVALGLYTSMRNKSAFKDKFLTFDSRPQIMDVGGISFENAVKKCYNAPWGGSTNILAGFELILSIAEENNVPQEDMPDFMIIFSDMQFNRADRGTNNSFDNAREQFEKAGYQMPGLVYWNLRDNGANAQVEFDQRGTALVSGFSPSVMKTVLSADMESMTPESIVLDAISVERYNWNKNNQ